MSRLRAAASASLAGALLLPTVVFAEDAEGPLTVYSGRSESLFGPVLESFTEATGTVVQV